MGNRGKWGEQHAGLSRTTDQKDFVAQKTQGGVLEGKEAQCRHREILGGAWLSCREAATQMCLWEPRAEESPV